MEINKAFSAYKGNLTYKMRRHQMGLCIDCDNPVAVLTYTQGGAVREVYIALMCYDHLIKMRLRHNRKNYLGLKKKREVKIEKAEILNRIHSPSKRGPDGRFVRLYNEVNV